MFISSDLREYEAVTRLLSLMDLKQSMPIGGARSFHLQCSQEACTKLFQEDHTQAAMSLKKQSLPANGSWPPYFTLFIALKSILEKFTAPVIVSEIRTVIHLYFEDTPSHM